MEYWKAIKNATKTFWGHKNNADDYYELIILDRLPIR